MDDCPKSLWALNLYLEKVQPKLAAVAISALSSTLGVSESYATRHPRRPTPPASEALGGAGGVGGVRRTAPSNC